MTFKVGNLSLFPFTILSFISFWSYKKNLDQVLFVNVISNLYLVLSEDSWTVLLTMYFTRTTVLTVYYLTEQGQTKVRFHSIQDFDSWTKQAKSLRLNSNGPSLMKCFCCFFPLIPSLFLQSVCNEA